MKLLLLFYTGMLMAESNLITIQSYEAHSNEYIAQTPLAVSGAFKDWLDKTLSYLDNNARIIEIGSAFGRDARYMESQGFKVERTDATESFVALLQQEGYSANIFNILTQDFQATYDLIFASAVFLHFTPDEFNQILKKIYAHLTTHGILSFSVKHGIGEDWEAKKLGSPRYFCYWQKEPLKELLERNGFKLLLMEENQQFIQVIACK